MSVPSPLRRVLPRPLRFANDANCFALSEAVDGAAAGAGAVFGVIVGTGTGGGVVVNGRIWTGPNAIAGEFGHNPLPWPNLDEGPGPQCYCGKTGCIETYLSGPGLARDHERTTGQSLDAAGIAARAAGGDVAAEATLRRYEDRMARALASVINVLDPDVVVLGGGLSNLCLSDRVPGGGRATCSPTASSAARLRRAAATPAASGARPGSGPKPRRPSGPPCEAGARRGERREGRRQAAGGQSLDDPAQVIGPCRCQCRRRRGSPERRARREAPRSASRRQRAGTPCQAAEHHRRRDEPRAVPAWIAASGGSAPGSGGTPSCGRSVPSGTLGGPWSRFPRPRAR
jgi:hypothetical protein